MRILSLAVAASLALASAAQAAPAAHKAAAKPAAPTAAAPPAAAPIPGFDAREPESIVALLKQLKADGKIVKSDGGVAVIQVTAPSVAFGVQMIGCDAKGKACHAMVISASSDAKPPTLTQINLFNRAQPVCRGLLNAENKITVMYFTLVNQHMTAEDGRQQMAAWGGCLQNFSAFLKNPELAASKPG